MLGNAFSSDFLASLDALDGPPSGKAAELAGPWEVLERDGRHRVVPADAPGCGAVAVFEQRQEALLLAALLPLLGGEPIYTRTRDDESGAAPIETLLEATGSTATGTAYTPVDGTLSALNLLGHLVREPRSLAMVLEAAGTPALRIAGSLLKHRIEHTCAATLLDLDAIAEALDVPDGPEKRREVLALLRSRDCSDGADKPGP